jgi:hypothetical protein
MSGWSDRTAVVQAFELSVVKQERPAVLHVHMYHFSDENRVITCINGGGQFTIQLDEAPWDYRRSALSRLEFDA